MRAGFRARGEKDKKRTPALRPPIAIARSVRVQLVYCRFLIGALIACRRRRPAIIIIIRFAYLFRHLLVKIDKRNFFYIEILTANLKIISFELVCNLQESVVAAATVILTSIVSLKALKGNFTLGRVNDVRVIKF